MRGILIGVLALFLITFGLACGEAPPVEGDDVNVPTPVDSAEVVEDAIEEKVEEGDLVEGEEVVVEGEEVVVEDEEVVVEDEISPEDKELDDKVVDEEVKPEEEPTTE